MQKPEWIMIYTTLDNEEAFCQKNIDGQYMTTLTDNMVAQYNVNQQFGAQTGM